MNKADIDYRFTCKLLNICANKALMDNALETRETILCAAEIIRYIFDKSKTVVPLKKEVEAANMYIEAFLVCDGFESSYKLTQELKDEEVYIDHLSLLSFIINDVENSYVTAISADIQYVIRDTNDLHVMKLVNGGAALEFCILKR